MTSIKDFLPDSYFKEDAPVLKGLLAAIQSGDDFVLELLTNARKQLFLTTAESSYLTNLANFYGFAVPPNSGLDETGFRALSIPAIWSPKQSIPTINKITELFYSTSVLHPLVSATILDPYPLQDGDDLLFETEDGIISILFQEDKFANISALSASEVASTINFQASGKLFADVLLDRFTGQYRVRVIGRNFGSASKIRCRGGSAQNIIKFEDVVPASGVAGTVWNITKAGSAVYSNVVRFTWNGSGTNPSTYSLNIGDFVSIRNFVDGSEDFSRLNGSYEIVDAGSDYFEIKNIDFQATGVSYTQTDASQIVFTSQAFKTLFDNTEYAVVSETSPGVLDVSVPAVPPIVRRPLKGATRLRGAVEAISDFQQKKVVIPYPNMFPDSGTFTIDTDRFLEGYNHRFFTYSSKNPPIGLTQALNIDPESENQLPFLSASEAGTALSVIPDLNPIIGNVDQSDIIVQTPGIGHYFENAQEIKIEDASISITNVKHKTVPAIYCPIGQDNHYFENDMDSDRLYIQFYTEDTKELTHIIYKPDPIDPVNRTRFYYLPELEGRFIKAVICEISNGISPMDVTATIGPVATVPAGTTETFTHNFGTSFVTFQPVDSDDFHNITGLREVVNPNDVQFTYSASSGVSNLKVMALDYQNVYPTLVRAVASNFYLPASPSSTTTRTLVHNLFSSSLIVELRVVNPGTTSFPDNNFLFFPKIVIIDDTKFDIVYNGLPDDINVDVFILASYFNPLESVDGGLLRAELNDTHIVRKRYDKYSYAFEVLGTGPAPYGSGTIVSSGKNVTGTGTQFLTEVSPGDFIFTPNGQKREVDFIISNTALKLKKGFNPSIGISTIYKICSLENNDTTYGDPVKYYGAVLFGFNVIYFPDTVRGTDIRFEFPDRVSRASAGFIDGTAVKLIEGFGFDIQESVAKYLRGITLTVHSQDAQYVFFKANIGATVGNIIQGAKCRRSGYFGGDDFKHYLPMPLSTWNQENWFKDKKVILVDTDLPPNDEYAGSYLYDTSGTFSPFTIGSVATTLIDSVVAFSAPGVLNVASVAGFPSSGYIFMDFGNSKFEGPIRYSLTIAGAPSQIRIDPAYIFKQSHADNSVVRLAASIFKPDIKNDASQFPVYLTGSVEARKTLEAILKSLVSVGVKLNLVIQIPELRFYEPTIQPFA